MRLDARKRFRISMTIYRSFVNGSWLDSASGRTAPNINPANINDLIGESQLCTRDEARSAVEAAYNAFKAWKHTPAPARGRIVATRQSLFCEKRSF